MPDDIYDLNDHVRDIVGIDRLIHEPARLVICAILYAVKNADFIYLLQQTKLTRGNLSSHLAKLEKSGYIEIEKTYSGKIPRTICQMTGTGREAFTIYREHLKQAAQSLPE
jgi:DNA-binding MarR family transcriptional regulator